ncbi:MAG: hypothetical protein PHV32_10555 [Eubacteriales bacterium]|jgi:N-acetylglutamate synthase-like GNAT family acetyltransferase|nr:hypothetical protein [Eubacteriales bacterium]
MTINSPVILSVLTPLLVHPDERGNHYGKTLLEYALIDAGRVYEAEAIL